MVDHLAGIPGTFVDGIFFTEFHASAARIAQSPVRVEISRQNANLLQVQRMLAADVRRLGGNALVGFKYGQRAHSIAKQVLTFAWDSESWHGEGYVANL